MPKVIEAAASAITNLKGGPSADERLENARTAVKTSLIGTKNTIAAHIAMWRVNRTLAGQKVTAKSVLDGQIEVPAIDVNSALSQALAQVDEVLNDGERDILSAIFSLPIKDTPIPNVAARALGATSFKDFVSIVLQQIDLQSPPGQRMSAALREQLPDLSAT